MYEIKKMERYLRVNLFGPDPRLMKKEFTGPRSHKGWEALSWRQSVGTGPSSYEKRIYRAAVSQKLRSTVVEAICWDRALVLWKKNLQGRGLTKIEKHCCRENDTKLNNIHTVSSSTQFCSIRCSWTLRVIEERKRDIEDGVERN